MVNFNTKEDTAVALELLEKNVTAGSYECVLVDNHSTDGSREFLTEFAKKKSWLKLQLMEHNLGFGVATNTAAKAAVGNIFVLMNPDVQIQKQGLNEFIAKHLVGDCKLLAPLIRYPNGQVQANGGASLSAFVFILQSLRLGHHIRQLGLLAKVQKFFERFPFLKINFIAEYLANFEQGQALKPKAQVYPWLSAAFLILRRADFEKAGGFDPQFFMYCEDADLGLRILKNGGQALRSPDFEVIHTQGTSDSSSPHRAGPYGVVFQQRVRSNLYFLRKNQGFFSYGLLQLFYVLWFGLLGLFRLLSGRPQLCWDRWKMIFQVLQA